MKDGGQEKELTGAMRLGMDKWEEWHFRGGE
jgi:hypothetical protein